MSVPVSRDRLGTVTAYSYAVAGGYTGTEAEFQELLANVAIDLSEIENFSVIVTPLSEGSTPTASYDSGVLTLGIPKGDTGDSGVYIGETAPTNPNVDVWINPNGEGIEMVQDVTVGGNSVVTDGVAEIPVASDTQLGIVQTNPSAGIDINPSTNKLRINNANSSMLRLGTESYRPITPSNQDASTFYGLAKASGDTTQSQSDNPVGTYTDEAKASIQNMLNVPDKDYVTGIDFSDRIAKGTGSEGNVVDGALVVGLIEDTTSSSGKLVSKNIASGLNAIAMGVSTTASGTASFATGDRAIASGYSSFAKGNMACAVGRYSSAEGNATTAYGNGSHAEGGVITYPVTFSGDANVTEYVTNQLCRVGLRVIENNTLDDNIIIINSVNIQEDGTFTATLNKTLSENEAILNKEYVLISGSAIGFGSHIEGTGGVAIGSCCHAEGMQNSAIGANSHAEGSSTIAQGSASHAEGNRCIAIDYNSHAEGSATRSVGSVAHTEGTYTIGLGKYSHSENNHTLAAGRNSHAENGSTAAYGESSHSEGQNTRIDTTITGDANATVYNYAYDGAIYPNSIIYIEDYSAKITSVDSVNKTITVSPSLVKECNNTTAYIYCGNASGTASHVEGSHTIAGSDYQHVQGKYNIVDTNNVYADIVGGGTSLNDRKNIRTLDWNGNESLAGGLTLGMGTQDEVSLSATELSALKDLDPVNDVQINGTSILANGVANIPIADVNVPGAVRIDTTYGLQKYGGYTAIYMSAGTEIKAGKDRYRPITPLGQHAAAFYGLAKAAGADMASISSTTIGVYPEEQKSAIQHMLGTDINLADYESDTTADQAYAIGELFMLNGKLHQATAAIAIGDTLTVGTNCAVVNVAEVFPHDVQVNGTSIVSQGVANVPIASGSGRLGAVSVGNGLAISSNGAIRIEYAGSATVKAGIDSFCPVTSKYQHESSFYGLAKAAGDSTQSASSNAVGTYTPEAKIAIKQMLGVADSYDCFIETVSGTDPVIVGEPSYRYNCGTVDTLTITPPSSGTIDIIFSSGSTPTVLTLPQTVRMPDWWVDVEANTTYEMCITDGAYCGVMSWAD